MPPVLDDTKCTKCHICVEHCPQDVFYGSEKKKTPVVAYPTECWHCNACVLDCPAEGAIRLRIPVPMMLAYRYSVDCRGGSRTAPIHNPTIFLQGGFA